MRIGLGHLGLAPAVFWRMTLPEFMAACDGYLERKGAKQQAPMTQGELDALMTKVDAEGNLINDGPASDMPRTPLNEPAG